MDSKRTIANCNNSKKSTGPRTEEGKRASSQNARKHGFTADLRFAAHEDPQVYEKRLEDFSVQLNITPFQPMQAWYVENIVQHTLIVDRLNAVAHARFADACARSLIERKESNAVEVERLTMLLKDRRHGRALAAADGRGLRADDSGLGVAAEERGGQGVGL